MKRAVGEMTRRRKKQVAHNKKHGITPKTVIKAINDLSEFQSMAKREGLKIMNEASKQKPLTKKNVPHLISALEKQMKEAADSLDFELAALIRDQIAELREMTGFRGGAGRAKAQGRTRKKKTSPGVKRVRRRLARKPRAH